MGALLGFYALALGGIIGSFLNVVIHRYPLGQSIVTPRSHCPRCNALIHWYDNLPVISFLVLRGKCRNCALPISIRYPLVEAANALFYLAIFQRVGIDIAFIPLAAAVSMTIALIYIDLDIQILPDVIDLPGVAIGIWIGALRLDPDETQLLLASSWIDSILGAIVGAGVILAIAYAYKLFRKVDGMGLGDVKMMAMIGAIVGWHATLPVLLIASLTGSIFGIALALRNRTGLQFALPFGVFLGFGTLIVMFFGNGLELWYRSILLR